MMSCQSLGEISENLNYRDDIEKRFELISNWYFHIVDHAADEQTIKIISQDFNIASFTIQNTIDWAVSCFDNESLHQSNHSNSFWFSILLSSLWSMYQFQNLL